MSNVDALASIVSRAARLNIGGLFAQQVAWQLDSVADEANAEAFRDGWCHMGDVFVRNPDGTLDFLDRRKYLSRRSRNQTGSTMTGDPMAR